MDRQSTVTLSLEEQLEAAWEAHDAMRKRHDAMRKRLDAMRKRLAEAEAVLYDARDYFELTRERLGKDVEQAWARMLELKVRDYLGGAT